MTEDAAANRVLMLMLKNSGRYYVTQDMKNFMKDFVGGCATEAETGARIKDLYEKSGYIIDPHTGVASAVYQAYREKTGDSLGFIHASSSAGKVIVEPRTLEAYLKANRRILGVTVLRLP